MQPRERMFIHNSCVRSVTILHWKNILYGCNEETSFRYDKQVSYSFITFESDNNCRRQLISLMMGWVTPIFLGGSTHPYDPALGNRAWKSAGMGKAHETCRDRRISRSPKTEIFGSFHDVEVGGLCCLSLTLPTLFEHKEDLPDTRPTPWSWKTASEW